jgi:SagB-type dehydrogenase family enzyme
MTGREYHESTKHSRESLRQTRQYLDWKNMPDPFRHYEGVPVLDLPAEPDSPDVAAIALLQGCFGNRPSNAPAANGLAFFSELLFHSAAVSASKLIASTGYRYALRVNPSSGNLHPTEFHFATNGLQDWPDGLYHYRPSSHMAEQRALGSYTTKLASGSAPITFLLTSIAWREAWKYGERAYRYCLLDMGHAWQSLALAARAMGCESYATGHFPDDAVARWCGLSEDEWPMLIVELRGAGIPLRGLYPATEDAGKQVWYGGQPNRLSREQVPYERIDQMHAATKLAEGHCGFIPMAEPDLCAPEATPDGADTIPLPDPALSIRPFGEVARTRRSALDFEGGAKSISFAQLSALLDVTGRPYSADFASSFIQLYLYVHRVDGLAPGVYRYWPEHGELERIRSGDQRVAAAGLSLGQDLAGNACVACSMVADLGRATGAQGERGYRYAFFEAGAIGQRLYLAAEALGLRATGIGAFFDDEVRSYLSLDLAPGQIGLKQVVYHFAVGYPVLDPRLEA